MKGKIKILSIGVVVALAAVVVVDGIRVYREAITRSDTRGDGSRGGLQRLNLSAEQEEYQLALLEKYPDGIRDAQFRIELGEVLSAQQKLQLWEQVQETEARSRQRRRDQAEARQRFWEGVGLTEEQKEQRAILLEQFPDGIDDPEFCSLMEPLLTPEQQNALQEEILRIERMRRARAAGSRFRDALDGLDLGQQQRERAMELTRERRGELQTPAFRSELEEILTPEQIEEMADVFTSMDELETPPADIPAEPAAAAEEGAESTP